MEYTTTICKEEIECDYYFIQWMILVIWPQTEYRTRWERDTVEKRDWGNEESWKRE